MASRPKQAEPRPAPRLYLITPPVTDAAQFASELTAVLGAADIAAVLMRLADGDERTLINRVKALAPVVQDKGAALLLDGHPDLVARGGADGAHLAGIDAFNAALEQLKPERIAGAGDLTSRHDAMSAAEAGADYIMFGEPGAALNATQERVAWAAELFELPCVAYANDMTEIAPLVAAGADFIAADFIWRDPHGAAAAIADTAHHLHLPESVS
ncbi:MAG TPA: thiamine phosphate synthase [Pseudolabrys sp.]|jgi:thiamine-phosphate pyrophosphorylase|nr:thiamine phosphate synthase [Pseudolabrys sp.]